MAGLAVVAGIAAVVAVSKGTAVATGVVAGNAANIMNSTGMLAENIHQEGKNEFGSMQWSLQD